MNFRNRLKEIWLSANAPTIRSKSWSYAAQEYKENFRFESSYQQGRDYTIVKDGVVVPGKILFKPLSKEGYLKTGLAHVPYGVQFKEQKVEEFEHKGGQIVFSTDVNATVQGKGLIGKLKGWLQGKIETTVNRLLKQKKLDKIMKARDVYAFSVGNFFRGAYKDAKGRIWNEQSVSVEIIGIPPETLKEIANDIRQSFKQESVLVKEYDTGKIYLLS
jgi:hypothetical protein